MTEQDRTITDLAELTTLAVLSAAPRQPDQIHELLIETDRNFVGEGPHALRRAATDLVEAGLTQILEAGDETGNTVFALTDPGQVEVRRRVAELLKTPTANATLTYAAISFISLLPSEEAVAALRERSGVLLERIEELEEYLNAAEADYQLVIEADFELERVITEEQWCRRIANRVEIGELGWA